MLQFRLTLIAICVFGDSRTDCRECREAETTQAAGRGFQADAVPFVEVDEPAPPAITAAEAAALSEAFPETKSAEDRMIALLVERAASHWPTVADSPHDDDLLHSEIARLTACFIGLGDPVFKCFGTPRDDFGRFTTV